MGIIAKLFGSDKVIDAAMKTGDALAYTKEEKAEMHARLLKLYEPYKLAQRLLALTFCIPYVLAWIVTFIVSLTTNINLELQFDMLQGDVSNIVLTIAIFYYGGGAAEGIINSRKP